MSAAETAGFGFPAAGEGVAGEAQAAGAPRTFDPSAPVTFFVVRHGETQFNVASRVQGWCDSPLTEEGRRVARALGRGLAHVAFDAAYASDLGRARQTLACVLDARAEASADAAPVPRVGFDARLREWCYGDLEGEPGARLRARMAAGFPDDPSFAELNERLPEVADVLAARDASGRTEGFDAIRTRLASFFTETGDELLAAGGGVALVVTHSFVVRTLMYLIDPARVNDPLKICNASVTEVRYDGDRFSLGETGSLAWLDRG